MFVLVTGGSASGKSEYAENLVMGLNQQEKIYLATMRSWDQECLERIERHKRMRAGKGFLTIECFQQLNQLELSGNRESQPSVLLECMSNLVANECFSQEENEKPHLVSYIISGVDRLLKMSMDLVLVTNEIFSDGNDYDLETVSYQQVLGSINQNLAARADVVTEVVAGIPIIIKGSEQLRERRLL